MKIALLGPKGTYSQQAAFVYNKKAQQIFFKTIDDIIKQVAGGQIELGILPFENSIQGTITQTIDGIYKEKLKIIKEIIININHCIAGIKEISNEKIKKIYSHPQALNQCKEYILRNFSNVQLIETLSTSAAFEKIKREKLKNCLAIGPEISAKEYKLKIIDTNIQDVKNNQTSFIVISKQSIKDISSKKTTIVIDSEIDRVGLLHDILGIFKKRNINLSKIESRPSRKKLGTYIFYITLDTGDINLIQKIMRELEKMFIKVTILGSYQTLIL